MNKWDNSMLNAYLQNPDKYVFPFVIHEKNRDRTIITYNDSPSYGKKLRALHTLIAEDFNKNFCDRNRYSFAYHKNVSCADALKDHLKSTHFIKTDIHHFFESITEDAFLSVYKDVFNSSWKQLLSGCFYQGHLSIGFITSPVLSDYYMKKFDLRLEEYLEDHPKLHYSRYSDDMLLSSEEESADSLNELFALVKRELLSLHLEINDKKTVITTLSLEKHNALHFLGLNLSKQDEVHNKVTISKAYILFLLQLIKKNEAYENRCKGLIDEINSRVAYLAYNSPVSFRRFQKKHQNLFGRPYNFVPKADKQHFAALSTEDFDYEKYFGDFEIDIHASVTDSETGVKLASDCVEIKKYIGTDTVVTIPEFVSSIGKGAFRNSDIEKVVFGKNLKFIGDFAFADCTKLKEAELPDKLSYLGCNAFRDCAELGKAVIGSRLKKIGRSAFEGSGIKDLVIGNKVKNIEAFAFKDCRNLTKAEIPESVETLGDGAFEGDLFLKQVEIMGCINTISKGLFKGCCSLEQLTVPDPVLSIEPYAFYECIKLDTLVIPKNLINLEPTALEGCKALRFIDIDPENRMYEFDIAAKCIVNNSEHCVIFACENNIPSGIVRLTPNSFAHRNITEFTVPEGIEFIEADTFAGMVSLKEVVLPKSLKTLGSGTFRGCFNLESVVIQSNLSEIPDFCFSGCGNLKNIKLPETVSKIGKSAFTGNVSLTEINFPNGLKTIEYKAFSGCSSLKELIIPGSLKLIKPYAFAGCTEIENIVVDKNNTEYDSRDCSQLLIRTKYNEVIFASNKFVIPKGIQTIGEGAFISNKYVKWLELPESVRVIKDKAFFGCSLEEVNLGNVTQIGKSAFENCKELRKCDLPESVTKINEAAFKNCRKLENIYLPASLVELGAGTFAGCDGVKTLSIGMNSVKYNSASFADLCSLESIKVHKKNPYYYSEYNCLIERNTNTIIKGSAHGKIASDVETIGSGSFARLKGLKAVHIPSNVKMIEESAFFGCNTLKNLSMDEGIEQICSKAFFGCRKLTHVTVPNSVRSIGFDAFGSCGLKKIELGTGITTISGPMFSNNEKLETVVFNGCLNASYNSWNIFEGCKGLKSVVTAEGSEVQAKDGYLYSGGSLLYVYGSLSEIPDGIKCISMYAFAGNEKIKKIVIPNTVNMLGVHLFEGCTKLQKVVVPVGLKIMNLGFKDCVSLKSVNIPDTVETIDSGEFENCKSLKNIVIPDSLKEIEAAAFAGAGLEKLTLGSNVNFDNSAFSGCSKTLKSIRLKGYKGDTKNALVKDVNGKKQLVLGCSGTVIGKEIDSVGNSAFEGSNIEYLNLSGISSIGGSAFKDCRIKELKIPARLTEQSRKEFFGASIDKITVEAGNPVFECRDNALVDRLNNSLKLLGNNAAIPEDISAIGDDALAFNDNIKKISIPAGVSSISPNAMDGLKLDAIYVDASNPVYSGNDENNAIIERRTSTLLKACKKVNIPDYVKAIGSNAFTGCTELTELYIPAGVKQINTHCFSGCVNLKKIKVDPCNRVYCSSPDFTKVLSKSSGKVVYDVNNIRKGTRCL